ncbi:MAG: Xaa-Pro peptidase family protein [Planctomycetes bacterium]|nr:Xaa-Pro peptidase family protein [Planctomycetota bacterium]
MDPYAIDFDACRGRQRRLLEAIEPLEVDLVLLTRRESVQWATGAFVKTPFEPIAAITTAGRVTLVLPDRQIEAPAAADELIGYEAKWHSTTRDEQRAASSAVLQSRLKAKPKRVACEFEAFAPSLCLGWNVPLVEIDAIVFELRRRKDADELRMLARANEANQAMYDHARKIVRPGANELDIYSELHAVAVRTLGEPLTYFGQDFRGNARGGPPRDRRLEAGELFILDLGVGFRGYHSDNCRTIAVGEPTDEQQRAWQAVSAVFKTFEASARAGVSCRKVFDMVQRELDRYGSGSFNHHLGHGVGLAPQEGPHLNPRWHDTLEEGNFIAVEPGVYFEELRAGIRLEQNYVVTRDGVQLTTDWPLEL